jgi:pimeloyl-ACP methyl ester carboxylesterase
MLFVVIAPDRSSIRDLGDRLYRHAGLDVEHHEATIAGIHTHWTTAGRSDDPVAVLLHGSGGSAALWYPVLSSIAARHRVVAVDMPGHGETAVPTWRSPGVIERMLDWQLDFLSMFDNPLLIGHSLGGYMALLQVARLRSSLRGMVLIDSGGIGPRPPGFVIATRHPVLGALLGLAAGQRPTRRRMERTIRRLAVDPYRIPHGQDALQYALVTARRPGAGRFQFEIYRSVAMHEGEASYKVWGRFAEITCPVLMVWGEHDYFPVRFARQAAKEMNAAHIEVLPNTAHLSYLEDPAGFNQAFEAWLAAAYEK